MRLLGFNTMCRKAENICLENTLVTYLHNGFAVSPSASQSQTMCLKTKQLVSDATLKEQFRLACAFRLLEIYRFAHTSLTRSVNQGWR